MKKRILTALIVLSSGCVYALPVGNPSTPSLFPNSAWLDEACEDRCETWCDFWAFRVGFSGDYVYNRNLKVKCDDSAIDETTRFTNAGYLALNICDRVDLFGTLGVTNLHIRADALNWGGTTSLMSEVDFKSYFSWSAGVRAVLWECRCFALGLEGEYFQTNSDIDSFSLYSDGSITSFGADSEAKYREWQVGVGASYQMGSAVPYVAVKWAGAKLDMDDFRIEDFTLRDLEANKGWGYAVGMTFTLFDTMGVTAEGRFADEKALYITGQIGF